MFSNLQNNLRRRGRGIGSVASAVLLLILYLFFYEPSTPDGIYYDPYIACEHGCWIFKDGEISIQCDKHPPKKAGTYHKIQNKWVSGDDPTNSAVIKPSLFGVNVIGSQFQKGHVFWLRDCFSWIFDFIDWIQLHVLP